MQNDISSVFALTGWIFLICCRRVSKAGQSRWVPCEYLRGAGCLPHACPCSEPGDSRSPRRRRGREGGQVQRTKVCWGAQKSLRVGKVWGRAGPVREASPRGDPVSASPPLDTCSPDQQTPGPREDLGGPTQEKAMWSGQGGAADCRRPAGRTPAPSVYWPPAPARGVHSRQLSLGSQNPPSGYF